MRLLLDTCAFLWFQTDSPKLSSLARAEILAPAKDVCLSAISVWEIARKHAQGKITLLHTHPPWFLRFTTDFAKEALFELYLPPACGVTFLA